MGTTEGAAANRLSWSALFDAAPFAQIVFDQDLTIIAQNQRHARMTGLGPEETLGRFIFDAFPKNPDHDGPDTETIIRDSVGRALASGRPDTAPLQKHDLRRQDGSFEERYWRITHCPVEATGGGGPLILQVARDVTEQVLRERLVEAQQRAAQAGADLSYFVYDRSSDRFWRSAAVDAIFGFAPGEAGDLAGPFFARMHPDDLPTVAQKVEAVLTEGAGAVTRIDYRIELPDGETRWVLVRGEVIADPVTQAPRLVGVIMDVSDLRSNEQALREAVAARDLLLKEVNHRVKNSLALAVSILRLEASSARGTPVADRLLRAADRVRAVAAVHGVLHQSDDVASVDLATFIPELCDEIARSVGAQERGVVFDVRSDPVSLPTDRAVPLALIVNELIANAFKHGFGGSGGTLTVDLSAADGAAVLVVADDGTGPDDDAGLFASTGLGGRLVTTLARQLGATLDHPPRETGYATALTVPLRQ